MEDNRPERIWVHPELKKTLIKLTDKINLESLEKTGYPIPKGLPISSKIASKILEEILNKKDFIFIEKVENKVLYDASLDFELEFPVFLLIFNPKEKIDVQNKVDKKYINVNLFKKLGIKENEIEFI